MFKSVLIPYSYGIHLLFVPKWIENGINHLRQYLRHCRKNAVIMIDEHTHAIEVASFGPRILNPFFHSIGRDLSINDLQRQKGNIVDSIKTKILRSTEIKIMLSIPKCFLHSSITPLILSYHVISMISYHINHIFPLQTLKYIMFLSIFH